MKKTMIRVQKNKDNPYVTLNKTCLHDEKASWKAKGIHGYLMSLPDDWQIYVHEIKNHAKDKYDSTASGIRELIELGYITRKHIQDEKGRFVGYEYVVFEIPQKSTAPIVPSRKGKSSSGKSSSGKTDTTNYSLELNNNGTKPSKKEIKGIETHNNFQRHGWTDEQLEKYYTDPTKDD